MPLSSADALPANVQTALRDGHKLLAIKLLCEALGIDMLTAKARIEAEPESRAVAGSFEPAVDELPPRVVAALRAGDKQLAEKTLREERNIGLREALDQVEAALGVEPEFNHPTNHGSSTVDAHGVIERVLKWVFRYMWMIMILCVVVFFYRVWMDLSK